jgi:hypothetical protein
MGAKLAVLVQPPGRGQRIARALEAHGYRVALHRDLDAACRYLHRVRAVRLLFVDQGERSFAGNDLLSCIEDFPSLRQTRVYVTLKNPNSVFAAALRVRGASLLFHPVSTDEIAAIAEGEQAEEVTARRAATRRAFLRLRDEAATLRLRTLEVLQASRRLRHVVSHVRRFAGR